MRPFIAVPIALTLALACTSSHDTRATDAGSGGPDAALDASASDAGDPRNCEEPSDCIVVGLGCCGVCGKPELEDVIAIRRDALPARQERCRTATCPACATMTNPSLIATCRSGQCAVVDVEQEDAISACHDDGDCRIRGTSCCEC
ncbi:MAG TPA: hypothetical protein VHM19_02115, partial [Polyangiales bacterium]|nr:hypothetical protein [Polyangiales bacterium]